MDDELTLSDISSLLEIPRKTIEDWCGSGKLKSVAIMDADVCRARKVHRIDLERFIENHRKKKYLQNYKKNLRRSRGSYPDPPEPAKENAPVRPSESIPDGEISTSEANRRIKIAKMLKDEWAVELMAGRLIDTSGFQDSIESTFGEIQQFIKDFIELAIIGLCLSPVNAQKLRLLYDKSLGEYNDKLKKKLLADYTHDSTHTNSRSS